LTVTKGTIYNALSNKIKEERWMAAELKWVKDRWLTRLEKELATATVEQEQVLGALWEEELSWWKSHRGIEGDSLRNPLTQIRGYIKKLPLTEENSWENPRTGGREHIGLRVFNFAEGEWVALNDRSRASTEVRLNHVQLARDPEGIVRRATQLLLSSEWAEIAIGVAAVTGRRNAEVLLTGAFMLKDPYSVWFRGQVKGQSRMAEFEIPTLVRATLVVEAVERLRSLLPTKGMDEGQVNQLYNKACNEVMSQVYGDLPARDTHDRATGHNLRAIYAALAVLWYMPEQIAPINYKAYILGHRYLNEPQLAPGATEQERQQALLNYSSHANYEDYQIGTEDGKVDGRRGIKLGQPGIRVIEYFRSKVPEAMPVVEPVKKRRRKSPLTNKTGFSSLKPSIATREWIDDEIRTPLERQFEREVKDDELLRRMTGTYISAGAKAVSQHVLTLDDLPITEDQRTLFRRGMALAGISDLLEFLLAAGEKEAQEQIKSMKEFNEEKFRHTTTSQLRGMKGIEAARERVRRAIYAIMEWNKTHRPVEQWFITVLPLQNLVGGRKEFIQQCLVEFQEDIDAHHQAYGIVRTYNRKPESIDEMIELPEHGEEYPWFAEPQTSGE
jgi:hypothetical protein